MDGRIAGRGVEQHALAGIRVLAAFHVLDAIYVLVPVAVSPSLGRGVALGTLPTQGNVLLFGLEKEQFREIRTN